MHKRRRRAVYNARKRRHWNRHITWSLKYRGRGVNAVHVVGCTSVASLQSLKTWNKWTGFKKKLRKSRKAIFRFHRRILICNTPCDNCSFRKKNDPKYEIRIYIWISRSFRIHHRHQQNTMFRNLSTRVMKLCVNIHRLYMHTSRIENLLVFVKSVKTQLETIKLSKNLIHVVNCIQYAYKRNSYFYIAFNCIDSKKFFKSYKPKHGNCLSQEENGNWRESLVVTSWWRDVYY